MSASKVALVVNDIASCQPWVVRCLEIRGTAEVVPEPTDSASPVGGGGGGGGGAIIRIHPTRIISWGIDPDETALGERNVT